MDKPVHWASIVNPIQNAGDVTYANNPEEIFYNDLDPEVQKNAASKLVAHAKATKYDKTRGMACKDIPSSYLLCELDNAIPIVAQEVSRTYLKVFNMKQHTADLWLV